jgi:hypothetical protein
VIKSLVSLVAVAHRHAETEGNGDLEALMATMEGEPVYEFFPIGRSFKGLAKTRRYYEHFFSDFSKRMVGAELICEMIGDSGVIQEYAITITHAGDSAPTTHRIMALLVFGEKGLTGERMYSDEKLFRSMIGPLWDELEAIQ